MSDVTRTVDPRMTWVRSSDADPWKPVQGITHYQFAWRDHIVGEGLRHELVAAGFPPWLQVTAYPQPDGSQIVDVSIPGDDGGKHTGKVEKVLDKHKGTDAPDHKALLEFTGSIHDAARRMAEGEEVSQQERDIVTGVLMSRL